MVYRRYYCYREEHNKSIDKRKNKKLTNKYIKGMDDTNGTKLNYFYGL